MQAKFKLDPNIIGRKNAYEIIFQINWCMYVPYKNNNEDNFNQYILQ